MSIGTRLLAKFGFNANSLTVTNVADPVNAQDAATKNYTIARAGDTLVNPLIFNGSATAQAIKMTNATEIVDIIAAAPASTQAFYVSSGATQYYTTNATANWILNFAWSSSTSMNTALAVGDSVTVSMAVSLGATAFYATAFQVDGTAVTPKWVGGVAPSAGDASSVDLYTFTIIKTASATYAIWAGITQFK